eukprot:Gb_03049 [translate_table: standard]
MLFTDCEDKLLLSHLGSNKVSLRRKKTTGDWVTLYGLHLKLRVFWVGLWLTMTHFGCCIGHTGKVYAWELPGVARNACNGLTPTVALQLATVVYGANLFSEPLEDLNAAWLLECLRTLVEGLAL